MLKREAQSVAAEVRLESFPVFMLGGFLGMVLGVVLGAIMAASVRSSECERQIQNIRGATLVSAREARALSEALGVAEEWSHTLPAGSPPVLIQCKVGPEWSICGLEEE